MRAIFAPAARFATHIVLTGKTPRTHRTVTLELALDLGDLGFEFLNGFGCIHINWRKRHEPSTVQFQESKAASTSSACSSGFTFGQIFLMRPSGPIKKVTRCVPRYFRPMKLFLPQAP